MRILGRWRSWLQERDQRVAAEDVAAWAEVEHRVRRRDAGEPTRHPRLSPTAEDLATIANPDRRPPADHRSPAPRRAPRQSRSAPRTTDRARRRSRAQSGAGSPTFADLLATVGSLGQAEINRMTVASASTIEWCEAVGAVLREARRELAAAPPGAPRRLTQAAATAPLRVVSARRSGRRSALRPRSGTRSSRP